MTLNYTTSWMLCVKGISEPLSHYEVYYNETTSFNDTFIPTDNNCVMITAIGCNITGSNANTPVQVVVRINTTTALTYTAVISTNDTCIRKLLIILQLPALLISCYFYSPIFRHAQ